MNVLALALACAAAAAMPSQRPIAPAASTSGTTRTPADVDAVVSLVSGRDVEVVGSTSKSVEVAAPAGVNVDLGGSGSRVTIRISGGSRSSERVRVAVPAGVTLDVAVQTAGVRARDLSGPVHVTSVSGSVEIAKVTGRVDVATTSGRIRIEGGSDRLDVSTISGDVHVRGARGELRVESVSGTLKVEQSALERTSIASVSGSVELSATLRKGPHDLSTHSGIVRVRVPTDQPLTIEVSTFSGPIVDELGPQVQTTKRRHERVIGKGGARLSISSFSGKVTLAPK